MQGVWVQTLVGELISYIAKNLKEKKKLGLAKAAGYQVLGLGLWLCGQIILRNAPLEEFWSSGSGSQSLLVTSREGIFCLIFKIPPPLMQWLAPK